MSAAGPALVWAVGMFFDSTFVLLAQPDSVVVPQITPAQGTIYLSDLGQPSTGSHAVGSDSWLAAGIHTGTNSGGYVLNAIQLGMTGASGTPSGFTVMFYEAVRYASGALYPGSSLGTLAGSTDPVTGGVFTYTASDLTLSPGTYYFVVLTAGTAVTDGAYEWNESAYPPSSSGGWDAYQAVFYSLDGVPLSWQPIPSTVSRSIAQFAIDATPVPEPGVLGLFGFGGLLLAWHRRKARAV